MLDRSGPQYWRITLQKSGTGQRKYIPMSELKILLSVSHANETVDLGFQFFLFF